MHFLKTILTHSVALSFVNAVPPSDTDLTAANYRDWIKYIRPSVSEAKWHAISWRNKMMPAVNEAKELNRPILLWAMNGNPCGET